MTALMIVPFLWHLASSMLDRQTYEWGKCQTLTSWPVVMLLEKELEQWLRRFCVFPLRWLCGPCQHINWGEDREEGGSGGYRGSDFPYGWVALQTWTENLGSRGQAEALTAVCQIWHNMGMSHLCARALNWPKYNLDTLTLLGSPLLMSKPFQLSVNTEIAWLESV